MSTIFHNATAGINAMKVMIKKTANRIHYPSENDKNKRIYVENTNEDTSTHTAVKVKEIYDNYNDFIVEEKRKTQVQVNYEQKKIEQLLKLEDLLCEKSNIFNELINSLYQQIQEDIVLNKQNHINENITKKADNIIKSIEDFDRKLKFLEKDVKNSIIDNIKQANQLINQISKATINIRYFPVVELPNRIDSFIDERDKLIDQLNDLVGVNVVKKENDYKIYLNNGICIIDNNKKQNFVALTSNSDERYVSVGYIDNNDQKVKKIENILQYGSLGALLQFKKNELTDTRNKIGQITVNFSDSINSYHTIGYDEFGHLGKQIFNISHPEVIPSATNRSSVVTHAKWVKTSDAIDTDYIIYFKDNHWSVTRLKDYTVVNPNVIKENHNIILTFDGIEFVSQDKNFDGDIYMIKPYSKTLEQLDLLVNQDDLFAFSSTDNVNHSNRNNAIIINKFNKDLLVNHKETLDESYQKFSKFIAYKCNQLEEELPYKKNMVNILNNKKISMSNNPEKDYQDLNYEQDCYLANVKVLEVAEKIFNEIIDCYS